MLFEFTIDKMKFRLNWEWKGEQRRRAACADTIPMVQLYCYCNELGAGAPSTVLDSIILGIFLFVSFYF